MNQALVRDFEASGQGVVASTRIDGRYTVRICCLNHTTRAEHVERVVDFFAARTGQPASSAR